MEINPSGEERRPNPHESMKALVGAVAAVLGMVAICSLGLVFAAWMAFG